MYLYSPHYIFYPCGGSIFVCHIRVVRPKSDRLSARKKKRLVSFLSKDYELKSQVLCEFEKKLQKIIQSRRNPASLIANLSSKKGGNLMKEQTKKEREIYVIGRPSLEHLSPNERKAFFSTLLMCVIEHYNDNKKKIDVNNKSFQDITD